MNQSDQRAQTILVLQVCRHTVRTPHVRSSAEHTPHCVSCTVGGHCCTPSCSASCGPSGTWSSQWEHRLQKDSAMCDITPITTHMFLLQYLHRWVQLHSADSPLTRVDTRQCVLSECCYYTHGKRHYPTLVHWLNTTKNILLSCALVCLFDWELLLQFLTDGRTTSIEIQGRCGEW